MKCPFCYAENSFVKDTRETEGGKVIRRRRLCVSCDRRFTTFERFPDVELTVIKRTGVRRPFDRNKIEKSISTALRKRNFNDEILKKLTDTVIISIKTCGQNEITSKKIGKLIMRELEKFDPVAYVRFASVYKDFCNTKDFVNFIGKLKNY